MKVILPSLGVCGLRSVEMRPATFDDLRAVHSMNGECEDLLKHQFVERLTDADFTKITKCDADYLFAVAALSISFNTVSYKVTCPECGTTINKEFIFSDKVIDTLPKISLPIKKNIGGEEYEYHILTAKQDMEALEYAMSEDDFDVAYQDAVALFTFGKTLDDIEWLHSLSAGIYLSAFIFQQCMFHGFNNLETETCTKCGHKFDTRVSIPTSLIVVDLPSIMAQYTKVSDQMSFDSFLNFTIPEFETLIKSLNEQV